MIFTLIVMAKATPGFLESHSLPWHVQCKHIVLSNVSGSRLYILYSSLSLLFRIGVIRGLFDSL